MRKYLSIIASVAVVAVCVALYFSGDERGVVVVEEDKQVATTTDTVSVKPEEKPIIESPKIVFGTVSCYEVSGKKFAKLPITLSEKGWFYGETLVKPVDTSIDSNSGKTFENIDLMRPFYELVPEDWGESVVTVKLWESKGGSLVATASKTVSANKICK